ncbi:MAG: hypothetical protein K0S28_1181 [Paucimonas sp.]|jgi:HD-GYP domain-containing protein (c-di-GMP phosphodiesterase class II)|nr:hypothetical protein [Paucimonas sp.]
MDKLRLKISDILLGHPLPWDVFDDTDDLMLRKGHVVTDPHVLETLFRRNLYIDGAHAATIARNKNEEKRPDPVRETPSVLRFLNAASKRLERLLYGFGSEPEAAAKVVELTELISKAVALDSEIALATIIVNQEAGHYAVRHCVDTAVVVCIVASAMQKPEHEIRSLMAAALTMNLGMLRQHDHFQAKRDALTEKERELIRLHPQESAAMLKQAGISDPLWLQHVLTHHENDQGSGYPAGNAALPLPQNTRILALADQYCAAVSDRKYKKTLSPQGALRDLLSGPAKSADPMLAAYFVKLLGVYPTGTLVRLQSNEIALVTGKGEAPAAPLAQALIGASGTPLSIPLKRDTAKPTHAIRETLNNGDVLLRFSMQQIWGEHAAL